MKTAVIYWSGTGNTEAMAKAVAEGAGVKAINVADFSESISDYDALAFGCPATTATFRARYTASRSLQQRTSCSKISARLRTETSGVRAEACIRTLEIKNLCAGYGKREIAHDISFTVDSGEILTFIGQNGSGKSTLLKTIAGQIPPLSGEIIIDGVSVSELKRNDVAKLVSAMLTDRPKTDIRT